MNIPAHIRALIDGALGADGYYGVFTANMHTDTPTHPGADAIVAEAQRRGVPVVSAAQMLTWLDGRNDSSFGGLSFTAGQLRFHLNAAPGSRGLQAMIPTVSSGGALQGLSRDGRAVPVDHRTVKGMSYVVFDAVPGDYVASYPAVATGGRRTGGSGGASPKRRAEGQREAPVEACVEARHDRVPRHMPGGRHPLQGRHRPEAGSGQSRAHDGDRARQHVQKGDTAPDEGHPAPARPGAPPDAEGTDHRLIWGREPLDRDTPDHRAEAVDAGGRLDSIPALEAELERLNARSSALEHEDPTRGDRRRRRA